MKPDDNPLTIAADMARCRQCALCEIICPNDVFRWKEQSIEMRYPGRCIRCGHCVAVCPEDALRHSGFKGKRFEKIDPFFELSLDQIEKFYQSRRSCRRFKGNPLKGRKIDALIAVARLAPTATNSQNVRFIVLEEKSVIRSLEEDIARYYLKLGRRLRNPITRFMIRMAVGRSIVEAYRFHMSAITERFNDVLEGTKSLFTDAPAVVIAYSSGLPHIASANCNLSIIQIMLAAESMRLGTCYNGYALTALIRDKGVRQRVGVPLGYTPGAVIAVGEPDVTFHRAPPRRFPRITHLVKQVPSPPQRK